MAKKFLSSFNIVSLPSDPPTGIEGEIYLNTATNIVRIWYNNQWNDLSASGGGGSNSFTTVSTPLGTSPVADSSLDTLTFTSSNGISITGDSSTDSIEFSTNATPLNTASTIVARDSSQSFDITGIDFDTTDTIAASVGRLFWDDGEGTLSLGLKGGNVNLSLGQEQVALCYNGTGSTIANGSVVYITGAQGQRPSIALADADSELTSSKTFGIATENIVNGSEGFVATFGIVNKVNTSGFTAGQALWLSSIAGELTNIKPSAPTHAVFVGYCLHVNQSSGRIFVNPQNGYEVNELHDVSITSIADNHILSYDGTTNLWKNQGLAAAIQEIDGASSGIDSDLLDGQHGSHYLDWTNTTNKPDPTITLAGDLTGSITLTDLNSGTLTASLINNISITNNLSAGNKLYVGPGAQNFDTTTGQLTNAIGVFRFNNSQNNSSYAQIAFQNADPTSSTDIITYMDNGSDLEGWMGIGIAGSQFDDTTYGITGPGDGYIFHETKSATPSEYKGNLVIATGANGIENKIVFAAGGYASGNTQMIITPDQNVHIEIDTPSTSATTGALTVLGGVGFTGATSIDGLIRVKGLTYLGEGAEAFETDAGLTNAKLVAVVEGDPYAQVAIHNPSATSSTDIIVYPDNGTDSAGWIDMGMTGSEFTQAEFGITGPNDGYIFVEAPVGTTGKGNLVFATGANGTENKIVFAAGGFVSGQDQMVITPDENVHIEIDTPSTSPSTGALTVVGGVGIQGDVNIQGTITFGGEGTTVETENLSVSDPIVFTGINNTGDSLDLGIVGKYVVSGNTKYAGVVRDASDGIIKFFKDASTQPSSTVNFLESGLDYASIQVGGINSSGTSNISGTTNITGPTNISGVTTFTNTASLSVNSSAAALEIRQIGTGNALVVEDSTNPDSTPFVINNSGMVGIGTNNPEGALHVKLPTTPSGLKTHTDFILETTGTGNARFFLKTAVNNRNWEFFADDSDGGFGIYDGVAARRRMSILPNGYVGFNKSIPTLRLDVSGATRTFGLNSLPISTPGAVTTVVSSTGGSLLANTYFFRVVAIDNLGGTTLPGVESSGIVTTGSSSKITVSWGAVNGADGYRLYFGNTSGGQNSYFTVADNVFEFTTTAGATSGALPTSNNTGYVTIGQSSNSNYPLRVFSSNAIQIEANSGTVSQAVGYAASNIAYSGTISDHVYAIITNNTERVRFDSTAITSTIPYLAPASTTSRPSLRLPHGTAPTAPTNGDIWTTTGGVFGRINGTTQQLASTTYVDEEIVYSATAPASPRVGTIWVDSDETIVTLNTNDFALKNSPTFSTQILVTAATGRALIGTDGGGSLSLGRLDSTSSSPYIDFNSSTSNNDYDARIQASGGSAGSGNGNLTLLASNLYIPVTTLNRQDSTSEGGELRWTRASDNTAYWISDVFGSTSSPNLRFFHNSATSTHLELEGNNGSASFGAQIKSIRANNTATGSGQIYLNGATGNRIDFNQNGLAAPSNSTRSIGTKIVLWPNVGPAFVDYAIGVESNFMWFSADSSSSGFKWYSGTTETARLTGAGAFSAVTKSFDIKHPTKENMRLRYGSLEGPENGVYLRGKSDSSIIILPDYWTGLVDEDSITVQLTAKGKYQNLYVEDISDNTIIVGGVEGEYFYLILGERKDVDKLVVEY